MRCVFMVLVLGWFDLWGKERELVSLTDLPCGFIGLMALDAGSAGGNDAEDQQNGAAGGGSQPAARGRSLAKAVDDDFWIGGGSFHGLGCVKELAGVEDFRVRRPGAVFLPSSLASSLEVPTGRG